MSVKNWGRSLDLVKSSFWSSQIYGRLNFYRKCTKMGGRMAKSRPEIFSSLEFLADFYCDGEIIHRQKFFGAASRISSFLAPLMEVDSSKTRKIPKIKGNLVF